MRTTPNDRPTVRVRPNDARIASTRSSGETEDLYVHVGRRAAEEAIAYLSSDEKGPPARVPHRSRDVSEARLDLAEVRPGEKRRGLFRAVRRHVGCRP